MLLNLFRKKRPFNELQVDDANALDRCLTALDLCLLGIGVIIGAGVFVLTGIVAATKAGPAISLSYVIAGIASILAALAYAELATSIGGCGSAYNYVYTGFGELFAWIIGWDLLFEYALSISSVAIGWSGYVNDALLALNFHLPQALIKNPTEGGIVNLPAILIIITLAFLLCAGIRHSTRVNSIIVIVKLITIGIFIAIASQHVNPSNWHPYFPFGWSGVMQGAALVFFAYIGFDSLSTAAEETMNPQRNLPIGIITSVVVCGSIYVLVAVLLTGIVPYTALNVKSPVAEALLILGYKFGAGIISIGAIAGLTTVMLVMFYGLSRICLAIARDGLLPSIFAKIHPKRKTPSTIILLCTLVIAPIAGFMPLSEAVSLVNIGTLLAFTLVCMGVIWLRKTNPNMARPFKLPLNPLFPLLGIFFCVYLMLNLSFVTWIRFFAWLVIGLVIYFCYSYKHSKLV